MKREFTGRHMASVLVIGFGIVIAVNMLMATLATRGFGGVVVENSYVASQKFNGWIKEAKEQTALGWSAEMSRRSDGRLLLRTAKVPSGADLIAELRRPLGRADSRRLLFVGSGPDRHLSTGTIPDGRWIVRLTVTSGERRWSTEGEIL